MAEFSLTGESASVPNQAVPLAEGEVPLAGWVSLAFAGSVVTCGRRLGLVMATGPIMEIGQVARLTREVKEQIRSFRRICAA